MTKFEEKARVLRAVGEIYSYLESSRNSFRDWASEYDEGTMKESYTLEADVYQQVMDLLEKTYLK